MKRLDNYLLVTDMDGTLYEHQSVIPEINRKAIEKFESLGGKFTIATGRGVITTEFITKMLEFNCPLIVNNGHTFYDYYKDENVFSVNFPESSKDLVKLLVEKFEHVACEVFSGKDLYVLRENDTLKKHLDYEQVGYKLVSFDDIKDLDWQKVLFEDELKKINEVRKFAKENCPTDLRLVDTNILFMEFSTVNTNKGTAILKLADMLGIPHENVCAIGNYYNDAEMVKAAGIGAYVNDTPDDLKNDADFVSTKKCIDGGLAEFIDYIINF